MERQIQAAVTGLKFEQPAQQIVFWEYLQALRETEVRRQRLEVELAELAQHCPHAAVIAALQSLRGVGMLTAVTLVAELGDLSRFATAQQLMAYVGLVPSEHSSGGSQRRGGITKCGDAHVRRVAVVAVARELLGFVWTIGREVAQFGIQAA